MTATLLTDAQLREIALGALEFCAWSRIDSQGGYPDVISDRIPGFIVIATVEGENEPALEIYRDADLLTATSSALRVDIFGSGPISADQAALFVRIAAGIDNYTGRVLLDGEREITEDEDEEWNEFAHEVCGQLEKLAGAPMTWG